MISFEEARARVLAAAAPSAPIRVRTLGSQFLGTILAEPMVAAIDSPAFDNSAVDGYGFRHADAPATFRLFGAIAAGEASAGEIPPGHAVRILTGAPIPPGVDTVAMQEDCTVSSDTVSIPETRLGANVRRRGEEYGTGAVLLPAGSVVSPPVVGLIAANGLAEVAVRSLPTVRIVATGSELVPPGEPLPPGRIYESNLPALASAVSALGGRATSEQVADHADPLRDALRRGLKEADVLVTTGGVSVGDHDLVKDLLAELGVKQVFWRANIKPGKPVYFGTYGEKLVFGLPGNPVAALVTFHLFVRPALFTMAGARAEELLLPARLTAALRKRESRWEFVPARLENREGGLVVTPAEAQGAHMLGGIASANALIRLPAGRAAPGAGDVVEVSPLNWFPTCP